MLPQGGTEAGCVSSCHPAAAVVGAVPGAQGGEGSVWWQPPCGVLERSLPAGPLGGEEDQGTAFPPLTPRRPTRSANLQNEAKGTWGFFTASP